MATIAGAPVDLLSELINRLGLQAQAAAPGPSPAVPGGVPQAQPQEQVQPPQPLISPIADRAVQPRAPMGVPYSAPEPTPAEPAANSSNAAPKPKYTYQDPGFVSQLGTFLSGLGRGGGAILPALGEGIRAVEGGNATRQFLQQKGASPEQIAAFDANPLLAQKILTEMFPDKFTKLAQGEALINNQTGNVAARNEPKLINIAQGGALYDPTKEKVVASQPKELSAAEQNEVFKADQTVMAAKNVQDTLRKAKDLSKKAYSGALASERAGLLNSTIGGTDSSRATALMDNAVTSQALENLKAIFGGNPTEGERKILLQIQGAASQPPEIREKIFDEAIQAAQKREQFWAQQADQLRNRTYLKPGGGQGTPPPPANDWREVAPGIRIREKS